VAPLNYLNAHPLSQLLINSTPQALQICRSTVLTRVPLLTLKLQCQGSEPQLDPWAILQLVPSVSCLITKVAVGLTLNCYCSILVQTSYCTGKEPVKEPQYKFVHLGASGHRGSLLFRDLLHREKRVPWFEYYALLLGYFSVAAWRRSSLGRRWQRSMQLALSHARPLFSGIRLAKATRCLLQKRDGTTCMSALLALGPIAVWRCSG
jgi:hypothetical protein